MSSDASGEGPKAGPPADSATASVSIPPAVANAFTSSTAGKSSTMRWRSAASKIISMSNDKRRETFVYAEKKTGVLSARVKLSYAMPMLSVTSLTMLISIHGTSFFTKIGLTTSFLAFFTAVARSIDVITDPLMGWVSDSTRTKYGRRRPYMFVGCVLYATFYIFLFSPPKNIDSLVGWFGVFYILFYLSSTLSDVPHGALGPELTDDCDERNSLYLAYNAFRGIGVLLAALLPVIVPAMLKPSISSCECNTICGPSTYASAASLPTSYFNETTCDLPTTMQPAYLSAYCACHTSCDNTCSLDASRSGFTIIAAIFGGWYIATMWNCVAQIQERKESLANATPPIVPSMLMTFRNKPFVGLLPAWVLDVTAITMLGTMMPFYMASVIEPGSVPECSDGKRAMLGLDGPGKSESTLWCDWETWLGMALVMLFIANLASMPLWMFITKKLGKIKTWLLFNLTSAVTNGLFVVAGRGDPKLTTFLAVVNGIPAGAQFLADSIVADIIDYDEFLTGSRSEGRFTIFQGFIPKIASIPAQAIPLALLSAVGYLEPIDGVVQKQSDTVRAYIQGVFYVVPCLFTLLSFVIKLRYPIKNEAVMRKISEGVAIHMQGKPAVDPLTGRSVALFDFGSDKEEAAKLERKTWDYDHFTMSQLQLFVFTPFHISNLKKLADGGEVVERSRLCKKGRTRLANAKEQADASDKLKPALQYLEDGAGQCVARPDPLVANQWRQCVINAICLAIAFSLVILGVAVPFGGNTLIFIPELSWVPIFSVIMFGGSMGLMVFNVARYKTALRLLKDWDADEKLPGCNAERHQLILRWVSHLEGGKADLATNARSGVKTDGSPQTPVEMTPVPIATKASEV